MFEIRRRTAGRFLSPGVGSEVLAVQGMPDKWLSANTHRLARFVLAGRVIRAWVVEGAELSLNAVRVLGALLGSVQLQRLAPHSTSLIILAEGGIRMAQRFEGVGSRRSVPEVAPQDEGLLIVVDGSMMVAAVVIDIAQAVQRGRLSDGVVVVVVRPERGPAILAGSVVLAESAGVPAHVIECDGFPY
jgi:hypothetical protein